jgi:hypothetical protein
MVHRGVAKTRRTSANRVLVDLIEAGLQSKEAEKERFFLLATRLTETSNAAERRRLKESEPDAPAGPWYKDFEVTWGAGR